MSLLQQTSSSSTFSTAVRRTAQQQQESAVLLTNNPGTLTTTTTTVSLLTQQLPHRSVRYNRLVRVMEKALLQSRTQFDIPGAIQQYYGEDASIFQQQQRQEKKYSRKSSDNDMDYADDNYDNDNEEEDGDVLQTVFEGILERVHDTVMEDMMQLLQQQQIHDRLLTLERVLHKLERDELEERQRQEEDKRSARQALQEAKLPSGMQLSDIHDYYAFETMQKLQNDMQMELQQLETDIQELEESQAQETAETHTCIDTVQTEAKQLEKVADLCSMISS